MITGPGDAATRFDAAVIGTLHRPGSYLRSGWINGLINDSVAVATNPDGLETATADAKPMAGSFASRSSNRPQAYRFISAAPITTPGIETISQAITTTFRHMSDAEKPGLAPLRVRVVIANGGDTLESLVARMKGTDEPLSLFLSSTE